MPKPIILISGGTGVGTSTFSFEIAKALNIPTTLSTDMIREVIRSSISGGLNPTLGSSTYAIGQTEHYQNKPEEIQKAEIIRGFKTQCTAISVGIEGIITRSINENVPLIIEGVHLIPGKIRESNVYANCENQCVEYLIHISDQDEHKRRFLQREKDAPDRPIQKYVNNFKEIRWIHDYLSERANRVGSIMMIDNAKELDKGLQQMLAYFNAKKFKS